MKPEWPPGAKLGRLAREELHPSWEAFIDYCRTMKFGEIERLVIQDGLPLMAETTRKKVKFSS